MKERQKFDDPIEHVLSIAEHPDNAGRPALFAVSVIGAAQSTIGVITEVSPTIVQMKVYTLVNDKYLPMDHPPIAIRRELVATAALTFNSKFGAIQHG